jgi:hypothetical protein
MKVERHRPLQAKPLAVFIPWGARALGCRDEHVRTRPHCGLSKTVLRRQRLSVLRQAAPAYVRLIQARRLLLGTGHDRRKSGAGAAVPRSRGHDEGVDGAVLEVVLRPCRRPLDVLVRHSAGVEHARVTQAVGDLNQRHHRRLDVGCQHRQRV